MKLLLNACLLLFLCVLSSVAHATYMADSHAFSMKLIPSRIATYDAFQYCSRKKVACAVTFIGLNGAPRYQQRMHATPAFALTEAEGNAEVALAFQTNLHVLGKRKALKGLYLTKDRSLRGNYFSTLGQIISDNPHYRATDGGALLLVGGKSLGAVGVGVPANSAISGYHLTEFIQKDFTRLNQDPAYLKKREADLVKKTQGVTRNLDDALLFSTVRSGKVCQRLGTPCSVSVVSMSGSLLVNYLQDKSRPVNQILSKARAVTSGATGLAYQSRRSAKIKTIEENLIGYRYISQRPMMAVMPGTEPLKIEGVSIGGVGVGANLSDSSPLLWGAHHRLIAHSVNAYLAQHYKFSTSGMLSPLAKRRSLIVLLNH